MSSYLSLRVSNGDMSLLVCIISALFWSFGAAQRNLLTYCSVLLVLLTHHTLCVGCSFHYNFNSTLSLPVVQVLGRAHVKLACIDGDLWLV